MVKEEEIPIEYFLPKSREPLRGHVMKGLWLVNVLYAGDNIRYQQFAEARDHMSKDALLDELGTSLQKYRVGPEIGDLLRDLALIYDSKTRGFTDNVEALEPYKLTNKLSHKDLGRYANYANVV